MRVFIVDDSDVVRERLSSLLLRIPGVEIVGEADTAIEAIEAVRIKKPDLVILDIRLKLGSGISVLTEIKKDRSAPIVMIYTGFPYPHYRERCLKEGAEYFFCKKDDFDQFLKVIKELAVKYQVI